MVKLHQRATAMVVAIVGRSTSAAAARAAAIATAVAAVAVALAAAAAVAAALAVVATETATEARDASLRVPPRLRARGRPSVSASARHAASRRAIARAAAPPVDGLRYAAKMAPLTRPPKAKKMVRVVVAGSTGRVGRVMLAGLEDQPGIVVVGGFGSANALQELDRLAPDADVLVDFTSGKAAPEILNAAAAAGLHVVSGTSGLPGQALDELDAALNKYGKGGLWAANFAIGGALMMYFARVAARFMDAAEVIELHHDKKVDAPSGTAVQTARDIRTARGSDLPDPQVERWTLDGSRGAVEGGVRIHSVRLPGFNAHQEVLFGSLGQVLSIRHDALGREAYLPGVALAVREVPSHVGLVRGLDTLMGLQ